VLGDKEHPVRVQPCAKLEQQPFPAHSCRNLITCTHQTQTLAMNSMLACLSLWSAWQHAWRLWLPGWQPGNLAQALAACASWIVQCAVRLAWTASL
jgi:hypothetical protein